MKTSYVYFKLFSFFLPSPFFLSCIGDKIQALVPGCSPTELGPYPPQVILMLAGSVLVSIDTVKLNSRFIASAVYIFQFHDVFIICWSSY